MPLLNVESVSKRFPGVLALEKVSLSVGTGEVLAVVGENGAGKSTLMKILAGVQSPDSGRICLDGEPVDIRSVREAQRLGIALIHQELNLADNLTIAENIFLGREPRRGWFVQRALTETSSLAVLEQVGLDLSPRTLVSTLSIGRQQMVEIAKALSARARILIMDEPTSSLSQHETEALFRVIRELRGRGVSIIYISHRLGEVKELADRVVVLRDGRNAGELAREEITHDRMVKLMVGRHFSIERAPQSPEEAQDVHVRPSSALEVRGLRTTLYPRLEINLAVERGEIVGLAGLVGAGRTELLQVLFGIEPARGGSILINGARQQIRTPRDAINAGLALVPEDRKQQGLILEMAVRENISLAALRRASRAGFSNARHEESLCREMIEQLGIKTPGPDQLAQYLSGGNQQKVVLAKWLALRPSVLLLDEPTRGVDVGAKQEIYRLVDRLAAEGVAILFVSSELEEILRMSRRVLVMHEGEICGNLTQDQVSEESIMHLATGQRRARDTTVSQ